MSQHDYIIDNASGAAVRADLNTVLQAILSANSGASAPSTTSAYMLWADTTNNKLKIRSGADDAWFEIGSLDANNLGLMLSSYFPNVDANITATEDELNILDGCTATATELNILDGCTASTAELNKLDGCTASTAELNLLDGKTFLDEDDLTSDSATGIASQQSIKAYVDSEVADSYLATIVQNENTDSDSITLVLPTGTWMVRADFTYHQTAVGNSTLTIDGDQVLSTPSIGDTAGTSQDVLFGYKSCSGGRTITCSAGTSNAYATSRRFMVMAWKTG